jgi:hypothetical protein
MSTWLTIIVNSVYICIVKSITMENFNLLPILLFHNFQTNSASTIKLLGRSIVNEILKQGLPGSEHISFDYVVLLLRTYSETIAVFVLAVLAILKTFISVKIINQQVIAIADQWYKPFSNPCSQGLLKGCAMVLAFATIGLSALA